MSQATKSDNKQSVYDACCSLAREGVFPTITLIKEVTGNKNTNQIAQSINEWKSRVLVLFQQEGDREDVINLQQEIAQLKTTINQMNDWYAARINQERIETQKKHQQEIDRLLSTIKSLKTDNEILHAKQK